MTAARKSQSKRNLFNRQFRLGDKELARSVQPPVRDIGMRRRPHALAERALKMTNTDPGKRRQLTQFDRLAECVLNILENKLEPATWKTPSGSRRSLRQAGIAVDQMVRKEFTAAFCIKPPPR